MIRDLANNPIQNFSTSMAFSTVVNYSFKVDCEDYTWLTCPSRTKAVEDVVVDSDDLTIEARVLGDTDWEDLSTTGLDLTSYSGSRKTIEMRVTSAADADGRNLFSLKAGPV